MRKAPIAQVLTDHSTEQFDLKRERDEALEQLAATSDVLQIVSKSPGKLEPVFTAMLDNAVRICAAKFGVLSLFEGDAWRAVALHGAAPPSFIEARRRYPVVPIVPGTTLGLVTATKQVVQIADVQAEPAYRSGSAYMLGVETGGIRAVLAVPMLKEGKLVGAFNLFRQEVRPFTDKQVELVKNFAAQAVIAIENARLLNELRQRTTDLAESLEQQTATSQVLSIISSSPAELEPVFQAILANATRLCDAKFGTLGLYDGEAFRSAALYNVPPEYAEARQRQPVWRPPPRSGTAKMARTKQPVQIDDLRTSPGYIEGDSTIRATVDKGGARTLLLVPMLKDDALVGLIGIYRKEVQPFTDKQVALVQNFAAQAVIAIENARLINELRQRTDDLSESLQQQTATADVLRVISSSTTNLQPVFESIASSSVILCGATFGVVYRFDGELISVAAHHNLDQATLDVLNKHWPMRPDRERTLIGHAIVDRSIVHIRDIAAEPRYAYVGNLGHRTFLTVPMLRDGNPIGGIALWRLKVELFSDRQIELVKAFADQAVIAIENARLLKELRERTDELEAQSQKIAKLNQQLERRVADQVGEIERMSRLRRFLPPQVADLIVASGTEKKLESHRREITALFCDLRGFTGFSERSDPEDVISLLREYHAAIGKIIIKYSGTLEHYAGDGVMVFFNDPIPVPNPALQAVQTALEMRTAIESLTEKWRRLGHELGFGVGIAHGFATLGTIGFEGRFDYAAIGTVSNVASRLCDEAKPGQILISPRVLMAVEDAVSVEPVGEFKLKGISRPLAAYNVLSAVSAKI
jgi:GAF domain-containing protein